QQPTQLNEVPWNDQTPVQRQQSQPRQQQNQLQQQSSMPAQLIPSSRTPIPSPLSVSITPATREPVRQAKPEAALQPKAENKP
ncbi:cell division protein FtsN, partial [Erwinia amylovora]|nr:cell division protein FtsN [Erwinia amylovora]